MVDTNPRMGLGSSKPTPYKLLDDMLPFSAAGILFSNETHALAGYQPHKRIPCITGIGGSRHGNETALQTAWRETIEELFDCENVPTKFLNLCETKLVPHSWFCRDEYICFQFSFNDLKKFLKLAKRFHLTTHIYEYYPTNLFELIMNRKDSSTSEIESLCLLPFVQNRTDHLYIHKELILDMAQTRVK